MNKYYFYFSVLFSCEILSIKYYVYKNKKFYEGTVAKNSSSHSVNMYRICVYQVSSLCYFLIFFNSSFRYGAIYRAENDHNRGLFWKWQKIQQDDAPPHCSRVAIDWLTEKFGEERLISRNSKFLWPPYSSDLNPLDFYFWGYLKSKVYTNPYPRTVDELKLNIRRECRKIGKIQISSAINNLNSRLQYVLAKKGGYFEQILNY